MSRGKPFLRRISNRLLHQLARMLPGATSLRPFLHRLRGVKIYGDVFIGDDVSDESGFDYVNEINGISVRVKPLGETVASHVLSDVAAVRRWISALLSPQGTRRSSAA